MIRLPTVFLVVVVLLCEVVEGALSLERTYRALVTPDVRTFAELLATPLSNEAEPSPLRPTTE